MVEDTLLGPMQDDFNKSCGKKIVVVLPLYVSFLNISIYEILKYCK